MYTAIIIEFRRHRAFHYVLNNIKSNLSDDWNIIIFHGNLNGDYVKDCVDSRTTAVHLPYDNMLPHEYSRLLMNPDIIYPLIPTETFLVFQTDSIIISKNKDFIHEFMHYDYIGAPWSREECGNGGFSIRKKSKMLEIIAKEDPSRHDLPEDLFFAQAERVHVHRPDGDTASKFSIEGYRNSDVFFACHKPWIHHYAWCIEPSQAEVMMLMSLQ
jgi:hypothetical protein